MNRSFNACSCAECVGGRYTESDAAKARELIAAWDERKPTVASLPETSISFLRLAVAAHEAR